jgi:hypothetical protein
LDLGQVSGAKAEAIREFLRTVAKSEPGKCWLWTGKVGKKGYGEVRVGNLIFPVHRLAFEVFKDWIRGGNDVLHTCDVRQCWNPAHLVQGTTKQNVQDMIAKGRAGWQKSR